MPEVDVREMRTEDYPEVRALWRSCEGIGLSESDSSDAIAAYLARNPGASSVARERDGRLVGAVLCGDDGRRGYLHHLAVSRDFLFGDNEAGREFWLHGGWNERSDLAVLQKLVG